MRIDSVERVAKIVETAWKRQKEYLEDLIRNDSMLSQSERDQALLDFKKIQFFDDKGEALREYLQNDSNRSMTETLDTVFQPFGIDLQQDSGQQSASKAQDDAAPKPGPLPVSAPSIVVQPPKPLIRSNTDPIGGANEPMLTRSQTVDFSSAIRVTSDVAQAYLGSPIINASHLSWLYARFNAYGVTNEMVMAVVEALPNPTNTLEYQVEEGRLMLYHKVLQAIDNNRQLLENKLSGASDVLGDMQQWLGKVPGFALLPEPSKAFCALLALDYANDRYTINCKVKPWKRLQVLHRFQVDEKKILIKKIELQRDAIELRRDQQLEGIEDRKENVDLFMDAAKRAHASRAVKETTPRPASIVSLMPFIR